MTELLVKSYQGPDNQYAKDLYALLSTYPHLEWVPPDLEIASIAAQFRARFGLRTVDALQTATALQSGATCLISNDASFRRVADLETILLDDYL